MQGTCQHSPGWPSETVGQLASWPTELSGQPEGQSGRDVSEAYIIGRAVDLTTKWLVKSSSRPTTCLSVALHMVSLGRQSCWPSETLDKQRVWPSCSANQPILIARATWIKGLDWGDIVGRAELSATAWLAEKFSRPTT